VGDAHFSSVCFCLLWRQRENIYGLLAEKWDRDGSRGVKVGRCRLGQRRRKRESRKKTSPKLRRFNPCQRYHLPAGQRYHLPAGQRTHLVFVGHLRRLLNQPAARHRYQKKQKEQRSQRKARVKARARARARAKGRARARARDKERAREREKARARARGRGRARDRSRIKRKRKRRSRKQNLQLPRLYHRYQPSLRQQRRLTYQQ
jgi:hypothetical protein